MIVRASWLLITLEEPHESHSQLANPRNHLLHPFVSLLRL